ncbi:MAG: hypothetical protein R3E84_23735 [Pseudomonadales bacterium]
MLTDREISEVARSLWHAEQTQEWAQPVSSRYPDADVADAYRISLAVRELKLQAGRSVKGHKVGLTSKAMRDMTGATEPDYGFIFDNWFGGGRRCCAARQHEPAVGRSGTGVRDR